MPVKRHHPLRDDSGATAVLTAVLASLLFMMAALAVDLTNAFSRRAGIQHSADQAARDAAAALPDACAAVVAAAQSLAAVPNRVPDDAGTAPLTRPVDRAGVPAVLTDSDPTNGEVTVYGPDLDGDGLTDEAPLPSCVYPGSRITVVAPPRRVDFGLGGIVGVDSVDLQAAATGQLVSAVPLLPIAVPEGCSEGPSVLRLLSPAPAVAPVLRPAIPGHTLSIADGAVASDGRVTLDVTGDIRVGAVEYWVQLSALTSDGLLVETFIATSAGDVGGLRQAEAVVPPQVSLQPGRWAARVVEADAPRPPAPPPTATWSADVEVEVAAGAPVPACDLTGVSGQLQLFVPPGPEPDVAQRTKSATASGIAVPLGDPAAAPSVFCAPSGSRMCVTVAGSATTRATLTEAVQAGLFSRLARRPPTCGLPGISLGRWRTPKASSLRANNSVGCYATLDVITGAWTTTNPAVVGDPRLFLIPIVEQLPSGLRPTVDVALPVVGYRAAYITAENPATLASGTLPTSCRGGGRLTCNGIELTAAGDVDQVTLYLFGPELLPKSVLVTGNGYPFTAGTVDAMLIG